MRSTRSIYSIKLENLSNSRIKIERVNLIELELNPTIILKSLQEKRKKQFILKILLRKKKLLELYILLLALLRKYN